MTVSTETILFFLVNFSYVKKGEFYMRKDIFERMEFMKKENIEPNYAELARIYQCDYRTVKRYFKSDGTLKKGGKSLQN